jgi:toxin ParE1/3/4
MNVVFTRPALADLEEIRAYLIARSPRGAANVEARIRQVLRTISEQPYGYQEVAGRRDTRRAPLVAYPYVIYYRIWATEVEIVHIRHGARQLWES